MLRTRIHYEELPTTFDGYTGFTVLTHTAKQGSTRRACFRISTEIYLANLSKQDTNFSCPVLHPCDLSQLQKLTKI